MEKRYNLLIIVLLIIIIILLVSMSLVLLQNKSSTTGQVVTGKEEIKENCREVKYSVIMSPKEYKETDEGYLFTYQIINQENRILDLTVSSWMELMVDGNCIPETKSYSGNYSIVVRPNDYEYLEIPIKSDYNAGENICWSGEINFGNFETVCN